MNGLPRAPVVALAFALALALVMTGCGKDESPTIEAPATTAGTSAASGAGSATTVAGAGRASGTDDYGATAPTTFTISVRGGTVDGPSRIRVGVNQALALRVTSDTADEVHVHGYDKMADVGPGKAADISFTANIPGTFEVELEKAHRRLTTLEVQP